MAARHEARDAGGATAAAREQKERSVPVVSVTRFRSRSLLLVPLFVYHASRSARQVRTSDGFLAGEAQRDHELAFWTMTLWRDETSLRAYVMGGPHRAAMPRLARWGVEASVVRWQQDGAQLPGWDEAVRRMRRQGRALYVKHPGPRHASLDFSDPDVRTRTRL